MQNDVKLPPEQRRKYVYFIILFVFVINLSLLSIPCIHLCLSICNLNSYKHAIDGLIRVHREEGFRRLFSGATSATGRGLLMTVGQIAFYDQVKKMLLGTGYFKDDPRLHFLSSLAAGAIATVLTQPLDVIKTRSMNAAPGEFNGLLGIVAHTAKLGPMGFFKGFVPAFVRLGPHTVITFLLLEQLRLNFGTLPTISPVVNQKLQA